ncbi:helix-turn-helix transcriptional regulator [Oceanobacter mangrovi]|uniref:helix-turn-helix transcriptional regulator n=1 Tax=Oceanobacter mangrovi TaxID=2862510 RepID=UPI001C8EAD89|nr:LuxR C-terminal-related transcriptional regulator [Oceanobacter mangrovi]
MISDMSFQEVRLLTDIVANLERMNGETDVRNMVLGDIAELMRAEFACSYVWDSKKKIFDDCFNLNLSEESVTRYRNYYQFHDPITFEMRRRVCSVASEVMPANEFYKTDYYQGHMEPEGLRHGINLYLFDQGKDIGDLRIWRSHKKENFSEREKLLLRVLEPHLCRGIMRQKQSQLDISCLTAREKDVAQLVGKGLTDREIANYLNIGFSTVRTHLNKSLAKLECANRAELAVRYGQCFQGVN